MSEFLGADFDFELDDILDPVETETPIEDPKPEEKPIVDKDKNVTPPEDDDSLNIDVDGNEIIAETSDDDDPEKDPVEDNVGGAGTEGSSSSDSIADYASALYDEGAFPDIEKSEIENVKNVEDLIDLNRKQIQANELRDLTPDQKEALKAFRNGISIDEFKQMKSNELQYDSITDDQLNEEEVASKIVSDYLKLNNTDPSVIEDLLESYKVDEKLAEKAKTYLPKIKQVLENRNKESMQAREVKRDNDIKEIKNGIDSTKEVFKGINLTEKDRTDLFDQMTRPAKVLKDGTQLDAVMVKRQEDPISFMVKLHYYTKLGLFDKEPNTEFLQTKARTKALSKLEEKLNKGNSSSRLSGSRNTSDSELFDFDDIPDVKLKF